MSDFSIRPVDSDDRDWIAQFITERWGAEFVVAHYETYNCRDLPGFVAVDREENVGLVTYKIVGGIPLRDEIELEMMLGEAAC